MKIIKIIKIIKIMKVPNIKIQDHILQMLLMNNILTLSQKDKQLIILIYNKLKHNMSQMITKMEEKHIILMIIINKVIQMEVK